MSKILKQNGIDPQKIAEREYKIVDNDFMEKQNKILALDTEVYDHLITTYPDHKGKVEFFTEMQHLIFDVGDIYKKEGITPKNLEKMVRFMKQFIGEREGLFVDEMKRELRRRTSPSLDIREFSRRG